MKISILSLLLSIFLLIGCSKDDSVSNNEPQNPAPTNPVIQQIFDGQILSSFNTMEVFKIIKKDDGFIFITHELITEAPLNAGIRISKTDNQLNVIWTFLIDKSSESDEFAGVLELSNNEYIAILKKFSNTNTGLYNNEVYGLKFNGSGTILWEKDYSMNNVDTNTHLDGIIKFTNKSNNDLRVMFRSDSTYYNSDDFYYREIKINSNGDILENKKLNITSTAHMQYIRYDNFGNKYNFGAGLTVDQVVPGGTYISFSPILAKYNQNNSLVFEKTYGVPSVDDYFHQAIIDTNNKIVLIGEHGTPGDVNSISRWIVHTNDSGEIVWEIRESTPGVEYYGKDIIQDEDGNYLSLFDDRYGYNLATLIKSDNQGQILWKYSDGEINNTDPFVPNKVIKSNNEYMIFGVKNLKLWLKKITVN